MSEENAPKPSDDPLNIEALWEYARNHAGHTNEEDTKFLAEWNAKESIRKKELEERQIALYDQLLENKDLHPKASNNTPIAPVATPKKKRLTLSDWITILSIIVTILSILYAIYF